MNPLQILFLIDNLRPGGAQKALLAILRELKASRAEPVVWCLGGSSEIENEFEAIGVSVLGKPQGFQELLKEPLALLRYLRRKNVALVQTFLFHSDVLGRTAVRFARGPVRNRRVPVVVSSARATNRHNRFWQFWLQRATAPLADAFTAVSERTLDFAVEREGVVRERAVVIPNGIDLTPWDALPTMTEARRELDLPQEAKVIGTLGRLHRQKGHRYLLEASRKVVAEFPDAVFLIAGYGPLRGRLEAMARKAGLAEKVRFLGYRRDVPRILAALDIFVLPSLWEGMSNALLEAMAAAKPVVATKIDGNVEQVLHGETGLLVEPEDADALAEALLELCRDPDKAREMGRRGRERVEKVFPLKRMTDATLALYARLLEEKAGIAPDEWRT